MKNNWKHWWFMLENIILIICATLLTIKGYWWFGLILLCFVNIPVFRKDKDNNAKR
jgi:hypothetical protein